MGVILQFAQKGVLLGQQNFNVFHTHSDYPGADVWLKSVDALVGERGEEADTPYANVIIPILSTYTLHIKCIHLQVQV